ncbi:Poly(A) ribonuclease pop2 [Wickerhamiella sorbophila]|uniref:poly(A)-specific ribonuclease n=1 Tax=Wickerhamiella sorbophila TaxID=45607 RepID=A0A2T0FJT9_9ASCO|nr:Poly(A) ribonuclease pop2 [Wickerhamiella sorbophila]PRT55250.1 Poly(A) ribonuclease pop2 [Wickerhamiella sorbophila]
MAMEMAYPNWTADVPDMYQVYGNSGNTSEMPVINVWSWNLGQQMAVLRQLVNQYRYISVDCKFPGLISRPVGTFHSTSEYHFQTLRTNVDMVDVIQIGLTLTDAVGNVAPGSPGTWQFNFKFNAQQDMCSAESLEVLGQSGFEFQKHEQEGIDVFAFAELLLDSGLVLNDQITWISFHAGYDLGYIVSAMLNKNIPVERSLYLSLVGLYFPNVFDVKTLIKKYKLSDKNGLHDVIQEFGIYRGSSYCLAGADSRLVALCYFEVVRLIGENNARAVKNCIFGLQDDKKDEDDIYNRYFHR